MNFNVKFLILLVIFSGFACYAQSSNTSAQSEIESEIEFFDKHFNWSQKLKKYRLDIKPRRDLKVRSAFCFEQQAKSQSQPTIHSVNLHTPMRIASLTKLYTSLMAIEKLGADYQFETFVNFNPKTKNLYLWGFDPLFNIEHVFEIIQRLNVQGITRINKLYISESLSVIISREEFIRKINIRSAQKDLSKSYKYSWLKRLLNTEHSRHSKERLSYLEKLEDENTYRFSSLKFSVKSFEVMLENEFNNQSSWLTFKSRNLIDYLKIMNSISYNSLADSLYKYLGGDDQMKSYLDKWFGEEAKSTRIYNGSGLNLGDGKGRLDNISTCFITLKVLKRLNQYLNKILPFAGTKEGTLKSRFKDNDTLAQKIIAKTGTLNMKPTRALAGILGSRNSSWAYFVQLTEYRPLYWRNEKGELKKSYPNIKKFEEENLDSLSLYLNASDFENIEAPRSLILKEIIESPSSIDK